MVPLTQYTVAQPFSIFQGLFALPKSSSFVSFVQRTFSQKLCGLSICIVVFLFFYDLPLTVVLGIAKSTLAQIVTDSVLIYIPWFWVLRLIYLEVVLVTTGVIRSFNLSSSSLLWPHPERLAPVLLTLNFLPTCLSIISSLTPWDNSLLHLLWSMCSALHITKQHTDYFSLIK